jgi:predicted O-linked N-acetylglucosamine transferase (SPINDLY family)
MPPSADPFEQRFDAAMRLAHAHRLPDALGALRTLAAERPRHAPTRRMLAALLHEAGRDNEALNELDAASTIEADDAALTALRADVLLALGRIAAAIDHAREALRRDPVQVHARTVLVRALLRSDATDAALREALDPTLLDARAAFIEVAAAFALIGAQAERLDLLRARAARHPRDYEIHLVLASTLHGLGRPSAALACCDRALALQPGARLPLEIRAAALVDRGDAEAGLAIYRELIAREDDARLSARYLVLMHYDPAQNGAMQFDAISRHAERHLPKSDLRAAAPRPDPEKNLRVGWLSPRFAAGPVATFLEAPLAAFDHERFRHVLIDLQPVNDSAAARLRSLAHETIDAGGLDDTQLLQRLRALDLAVLIDLAGHSTANRIAVVARRVAPVQICWLDWFDSTGAAAMDAWISDAWLTPSDSSQRYSERVLRLPAGRFCYTPPRDAPAPMRTGDARAIMFASFNRLAKFNDHVLDAWCAILQRVPHARLELRARHLDEPATREHVARRFAARGIAAERLQLHGHVPYAQLLEAYRRVDIALDPFPFSGCTTTCDALWMGCPVIALEGETFVARQGASLLRRLGHDEWIARDASDYVERAASVASDIAAMRAQRETLRETVAVRLGDARAQAADFAAALRTLWREHCASGA